MFNEVDADGNNSISWEEFFAFWKNVVGSGYSEDDLVSILNRIVLGIGRTLPLQRRADI